MPAAFKIGQRVRIKETEQSGTVVEIMQRPKNMVTTGGDPAPIVDAFLVDTGTGLPYLDYEADELDALASN